MIKILKKERRSNANAVAGIKREIMLLTMMRHPNVLRGERGTGRIGMRSNSPIVLGQPCRARIVLPCSDSPATAHARALPTAHARSSAHSPCT